MRSEARQEAEQRSNDRCPSSRRSFGEKHGYFILWSTVSEDRDSNIDTLSHNICARFSLHGCTPMCPCPCVADLVADRCARAGAKAAGSRSTRRTYRPRPSAAHRSGLANWSPHPPPATAMPLQECLAGGGALSPQPLAAALAAPEAQWRTVAGFWRPATRSEKV